ncbi:MAG: DUF4239 domain-containing protein [Gemmatimonadota bacterium]
MDRFLDAFPDPVIFLFIVATTWLAIEAGYRIGKKQMFRGSGGAAGSAAGIQGSILALLAFVLALTFNMAVTRFEARKRLVISEANAIGTCFLRGELLPAPIDSEVRTLLREYVDVRVELIQTLDVEKGIARSEEIQEQLWDLAVRQSGENPESFATLLFTQSLNEVIDLHEQRVVAGIYDRIPGAILVVLYLVSILAMLTVGYILPKDGARRSVANLALVLAFALVAILIVDLDRPGTGVFTTNQQAMIDLQSTMTR